MNQDQLNRMEGLLKEILYLLRERAVAEETVKFRLMVDSTALSDDIYALLEAGVNQRIPAIRAGKRLQHIIE